MLTRRQFTITAGSVLTAASLNMVKAGASPQDTELRVSIDGIDDQDIAAWPSIPLKLRFTDSTPIAMTSVSGKPSSLPRFDKSQKLFQFTASSADVEPFEVTFTISGSAKGHVVRIVPVPTLLEEDVLLNEGNDVSAQVATSISPLITPDIATDAPSIVFNATHAKTSSYLIAAREIRIDQTNDVNGLYNLLNNNETLSTLRLHSETLIIAAQLSLPQTNVEIMTRSLQFTDGPGYVASIDTTPRSDWAKPGKSFAALSSAKVDGTPGQAGQHGMNAGNITLIVKTLNATPAQRLIARGGDGQTGGAGLTLGSSVASLPVQTIKKTHEDKGYETVPYSKCAVYVEGGGFPYQDDVGTKIAPSSGLPGIPPGQPGNGGSGGTISHILPESVIRSVAVPPTSGSPGASLSVMGSSAGSPNPFCWVKYVIQTDLHSRGPTTYVIHGVKSLRGPEELADYSATPASSAPADPTTRPSSGSIVPANARADYAWLSSFALQAIVSDARNAYIAGDISAPVRLLGPSTPRDGSSYSEILANTPSLVANDPSFAGLRLQISSMLQRAQNNLDYFGYPAGWAPKIDLEIAAAIFDNDIDISLRSIFLARHIQRITQREDLAQAALESAHRHLIDDLASTQTAFNKLEPILADLGVQAQGITDEIASIMIQIAAEEQRLTALAKASVEAQRSLPFWKTALRAIGTIASIIPVYQPVLGAIGQGLILVTHIDEQSSLDTLKQIPDIAKNFSSEGFAESRAQTTQLFAGLIGSKPAKDKVQALMAISNKFGGKLDEYSARTQVSTITDQDVQAELSRLEANDPIFTTLIDKVRTLTEKKNVFAQRLAIATQQIAELISRMERDGAALDHIADDLIPKRKTFSPETIYAMKRLESDSYDRLLRYQYLISRAYEYRFSESYDSIGTVKSLQPLIEEMDNHVASSPAISADLLKEIGDNYRLQLQSITDSLVDHVNASVTTLNTIFLHLSDSELKTLNLKGLVVINLPARALILDRADNQRIEGLAVDFKVSSPGSTNGTVQVTIAHDWYSRIFARNQFYLFRHGSATDTPAWLWGATYDIGGLNHTVTPVEEDPHDKALLTTLIRSKDKNATYNFFTQPSAWTKLVVRLDRPADPNIQLTEVVLTIKIRQRASGGSTVLYVAAPEIGFPCIRCEEENGLIKKDVNGRSIGRGDFARVYPSGNYNIKVSAPTRLGKLKLTGWRDPSTQLVVSKSSSIVVNMDSSQSSTRKLQPIYA